MRNIVNVNPDFHRLPAWADSLMVVDAYNLGKGHILIGLVEMLRERNAREWTHCLRDLACEGFNVLDLLNIVGERIKGNGWSMEVHGPLLKVFLHNSIFL